jgi:hypothetical protein
MNLLGACWGAVWAAIGSGRPDKKKIPAKAATTAAPASTAREALLDS